MSDDPKKPEPPRSFDTSRFAAARAKDAAEGRVWQPKIPSPEEIERALWEPVKRAVEAKRAAIEQAQKEAEEFERGLQEKLESMEANPPADTAEPAVDVQAPKPKAARQAKSAKSKRAKPTKPGRFAVSDRLHFPAMEKLIVDGMSVEAAAQRLGEHLQGAGTPENKGHRLAKLYRKERGR
jgi:hypothetical protein